MYYVGCSGWHYEDWKGVFYPEDLSKSRWLEYYAQHFSSVEVNSTFYHLPKQSTIEGWKKRTPEGFVLSLKMSKHVSHTLRFENAHEPIEQFYERASGLGDKLGCILVQLPPSMKMDKDVLERILSQLDTQYRNSIEFRHPSWLTREVWKTLDEYGVAMCLVSSPKMESLLDGYTPSIGYAYVRLHGTSRWYRHDYTREELERWAHRIREFSGDVYVYFNNDFNAYAVKNATELMGML